MATRIASMRCLSPILQSTLELRRNVITTQRHLRRRRQVTVLTSNNDYKEKVAIQSTEQVFNENKTHEKARFQRPETVTSVSERHENISHMFSRETAENAKISKHQFVPYNTKMARFGEVDGLLYEKSQPGDKRLTKLLNIARSKKVREQQDKVILEGKHLICSALNAGAVAQTLFFSSLKTLQQLPLNNLKQASLVKVKIDDLKFSSDLDTSQDLIAVFKRPTPSDLTYPEEKYDKPLPLTLICDNVRDPGNLGAVLRSAAAAGCHRVLLTKGCVDIWEPKVLRSAMAAHFHLPVITSLTWSDIQSHLPDTATVHVADNSATTATTDDRAVTSRNKKKPCDYGWVKGHQYPTKVYEDDFEDYEGSRCVQPSKSLKTQYYHTDWVAGHTCIVIGGETHGLSREASRLAERSGGRRLLIPMVYGVDSLNSAMAASILLFEGRRQLERLIRETSTTAS